jgi:hypothetical protein
MYRYANFRMGVVTVSCSMLGLISEGQTGTRQSMCACRDGRELTTCGSCVHAADRDFVCRQPREWFSQKTLIAGTLIPNWALVVGAIIIIFLVRGRMKQAINVGLQERL